MIVVTGSMWINGMERALQAWGEFSLVTKNLLLQLPDTKANGITFVFIPHAWVNGPKGETIIVQITGIKRESRDYWEIMGKISASISTHLEPCALTPNKGSVLLSTLRPL